VGLWAVRNFHPGRRHAVPLWARAHKGTMGECCSGRLANNNMICYRHVFFFDFMFFVLFLSLYVRFFSFCFFCFSALCLNMYFDLLQTIILWCRIRYISFVKAGSGNKIVQNLAKSSNVVPIRICPALSSGYSGVQDLSSGYPGWQVLAENYFFSFFLK